MLSYKHGFLFVHVFKVAGTTLRASLEPYSRLVDRQRLSYLASRVGWKPDAIFRRLKMFPYHVTAAELRAAIPAADWDRLFKFAFVRNSWDWQVSLYEYVRQSKQHYHHEQVVRLTFDEYIRWRLSNDFRLQRSFVCDAKGDPILDFIGRFENLEADFSNVTARLGISASLGHANETDRRDYRTYYTPETRRLVADAFAPDIELFEFEFDNGVHRPARTAT